MNHIPSSIQQQLWPPRVPSIAQLLWPTHEELPFPINYIPRLCRLASLATISPVLLLLAVDVAAYLYFRIRHQPWFFGERTYVDALRSSIAHLRSAFWTFERPTWRRAGTATPSASSPAAGQAAVLASSPESDTKTRTSKKATATESKGRPPKKLTEADVPPRTDSPRRTQSWVKMRAGAVGFDGPLLGFEAMRSPSPEERGGSSSDEWIRPEDDQ